MFWLSNIPCVSSLHGGNGGAPGLHCGPARESAFVRYSRCAPTCGTLLMYRAVAAGWRKRRTRFGFFLSPAALVGNAVLPLAPLCKVPQFLQIGAGRIEPPEGIALQPLPVPVRLWLLAAGPKAQDPAGFKHVFVRTVTVWCRLTLFGGDARLCSSRPRQGRPLQACCCYVRSASSPLQGVADWARGAA